MSTAENYNLLVNCLSEYLFDKQFDMSASASMLGETIFKCVDLDPEKLADALSQINIIKRKTTYFKEPKFFKYDVSSDTQTVFVKFVISPNSEPIMLFFNSPNNEQSPFFKVSAVRRADGKHLFAETSGDQSSQRIADVLKYTFFDEYISSDSGLTVKKRTNAFSKYSDMVAEKDAFSGLNPDFLQAISLALEKSKVKLNSIDARAAGALVASFCEMVSGLCVTEDEFSFGELSHILSGVLSDDNDAEYNEAPVHFDCDKLGEVAGILADAKQGGIYEFDTASANGRALTISANRNPKYVSVDIANGESGRILHKYIVVETTDGFTIYRSKNPNAQSSPTDSFVISLSGTSMSFKAVGNSVCEFGETPMELVLNIMSNGDVSLSSVVESKLAHGQMSLGKHGAEDILNSKVFSPKIMAE